MESLIKNLTKLGTDLNKVIEKYDQSIYLSMRYGRFVKSYYAGLLKFLNHPQSSGTFVPIVKIDKTMLTDPANEELWLPLGSNHSPQSLVYTILELESQFGNLIQVDADNPFINTGEMTKKIK